MTVPSVKWPAMGVVALGLAVSGCGVSEGPRLGGVAAEVADQTITLEDVDVLTEALCTSNEATGDPRYSRPRSQMQNDLVGALVQAALVRELDLGSESKNTVDPDQVPGFADMTDDEQRELQEFLDDDARLRSALQQVTDGQAASPEAATQAGLEALAERVDEAGIEVTINPRYELAFEEGRVTDGGSLSTPVSDEAAGAEEVDIEQLRSLPAAQLCGVRPEAPAAG